MSLVQEYERYFEDAYPGHVATVHMALNYRELSVNLRHQTRLVDKILMNNVQLSDPEGEKNYRTMKALLVAYEAQEAEIRKKPAVSTRIAFVTFNTKVAASQVRSIYRRYRCPVRAPVLHCADGVVAPNAHSAPLPQFIADHRIGDIPDTALGIKENKAQFAPLPGDMYWENIAFTKPERYVRMLGTCVDKTAPRPRQARSPRSLHDAR